MGSTLQEYAGIVGASPAMQEVFEIIKRVASEDASVLITGHSGTGKELIAKALHEKSGRKGKFVAVNCGAIPESLFESELFGYAEGAFTGAKRKKKGQFEIANEGTLFLDEIGDISLDLQVKLLRAIQEKEITSVGAEKSMPIDVRIIAATNKDIENELDEGNFREDLYYRLNVIPIKMSPLNQRADDIPLLVKHFVKKIEDKKKGDKINVTEEEIEHLKALPWPGNVRELENAIERHIALGTSLTDYQPELGRGAKDSAPEEQSYQHLKASITKYIIGWNDNKGSLHNFIVSLLAEPIGTAFYDALTKGWSPSSGTKKELAKMLALSTFKNQIPFPKPENNFILAGLCKAYEIDPDSFPDKIKKHSPRNGGKFEKIANSYIQSTSKKIPSL